MNRNVTHFWKKISIFSIAIIGFIAVPLLNDPTDIVEARRFKKHSPHPQNTIAPTPTPTPTLTPKPTPKPSQRPTPTPSAKPGNTLTMQWITFYGWPDNDPAGAAIAYPKNEYPTKTIHSKAGGIGTFTDPITFASDPTEFPIGTKIYIPYLKKYFIMEDWCAGCVSNWKKSPKVSHIDLWMNSTAQNTAKLFSCQNNLTVQKQPIELNPPSTRTVNTSKLFDPVTGVCFHL